MFGRPIFREYKFYNILFLIKFLFFFFFVPLFYMFGARFWSMWSRTHVPCVCVCDLWMCCHLFPIIIVLFPLSLFLSPDCLFVLFQTNWDCFSSTFDDSLFKLRVGLVWHNCCLYLTPPLIPILERENVKHLHPNKSD